MVENTTYDQTVRTLKQAFNGHGLIFTPLGEADVDKFGSFMAADGWDWINHIGGEPYESYVADRELAYMEKTARAAGHEFNFMLQREEGGPYIGHINVTTHPGGTAMLSSFVVRSERNQGTGTQMTQTVTRQLGTVAEELGVREIMGRILESNVPSRRSAEKAGWAIDTSRPRVGSYLDYVKELRSGDKPRSGADR